MAITLDLKQRVDTSLTMIPFGMLAKVLDDPAKTDAQKIELLREVMEKLDTPIHDKHWLSAIVDWMPENVALTEVAPYIRLAERIGRLDGEREGPFTLSDYQAELIWKRLTSPNFKTFVRLTAASAGFLVEFLDKSGRRFEGEQADREGDDAPHVAEPETP